MIRGRFLASGNGKNGTITDMRGLNILQSWVTVHSLSPIGFSGMFYHSGILFYIIRIMPEKEA